MKDSQTKKKGTLKKFFSRLMRRGAHDEESLTEHRPEASSQSNSREQPQSGSHEQKAVACDQEITNIPVRGKIVTNGGQDNETTHHGGKLSEDVASNSSKMPVIKRALSPIDGYSSMDPGEVETTIYKSYRRRSRNANSNSSPKARPFSAVFDEKLTKQAVEVSKMVQSPPVPPSKIPDFKLHVPKSDPKELFRFTNTKPEANTKSVSDQNLSKFETQGTNKDTSRRKAQGSNSSEIVIPSGTIAGSNRTDVLQNNSQHNCKDLQVSKTQNALTTEKYQSETIKDCELADKSNAQSKDKANDKSDSFSLNPSETNKKHLPTQTLTSAFTKVKLKRQLPSVPQNVEPINVKDCMRRNTLTSKSKHDTTEVTKNGRSVGRECDADSPKAIAVSDTTEKQKETFSKLEKKMHNKDNDHTTSRGGNSIIVPQMSSSATDTPVNTRSCSAVEPQKTVHESKEKVRPRSLQGKVKRQLPSKISQNNAQVKVSDLATSMIKSKDSNFTSNKSELKTRKSNDTIDVPSKQSSNEVNEIRSAGSMKTKIKEQVPFIAAVSDNKETVDKEMKKSKVNIIPVKSNTRQDVQSINDQHETLSSRKQELSGHTNGTHIPKESMELETKLKGNVSRSKAKPKLATVSNIYKAQENKGKHQSHTSPSQTKRATDYLHEQPNVDTDLEIDLASVEHDFAKPLASSTLQRAKDKKEKVEQSTGLNERTDGNQSSGTAPKTQLSETELMAESIRRKRLLYFQTESPKQNNEQKTAPIDPGKNKKDLQSIVVTIPNIASAHNVHNVACKQSIDPSTNVSKPMSPVVSNNKSKSCVSHQSRLQTNRISDNNLKSTTPLEDLDTTLTGECQNELDDTTHMCMASNVDSIKDTSSKRQSDNVSTTYVDSTIVVPNENTLGATLTVSHGNRDSLPQSLREESMADISSASGNNDVLRYQLTIQDNATGININVNRTCDMTVLDLMDVSQDGIQRSQTNQLANDSQHSFAIHPDMSQLTASIASFFSNASTIVGENDWNISYQTTNNEDMFASDTFIEDNISDITCDTTYLMDANAWGDDGRDHNTTHTMCDPVSDPLHLNCRLRHIPLQEQSFRTETRQSQQSPQLSRMGFPWHRYQELQGSRTFTPPWRSENAVSSNAVQTTPNVNVPLVTTSAINTQSTNVLQSSNSRTPSVLQTLIRPVNRDFPSTTSIPVSGQSHTQTERQNPDNRRSESEQTSNSISSTESRATPVDTQVRLTISDNLPSRQPGSVQSISATTNASASVLQNDSTSAPSSVNPNSEANEPPVSRTKIRRPVSAQNIGYTNAIIEEEPSSDSINVSAVENKSNKGNSASNPSKGKSSKRSKDTITPVLEDRPVAVIVPRQRVTPTLTQDQAQSTQSTTPVTTTLITNTQPSLLISSTVAFGGSAFSTVAPRTFSQRQSYETGVPSGHTRPASAFQLSSTQSSSPFPSSTTTLTTRSMTPGVNTNTDVSARLAFERSSRTTSSFGRGRLENPPRSINVYADRFTPPHRRNNAASQDDSSVESRRGPDFVYVDEDVNDLATRQTFRRFGLASTIQPSMRRARTNQTSTGRRPAVEDNSAEVFAQTRSLEETVAALRHEIVRVPGALILSIRRNRLVVYLSQDRPNVEGVITFMQQHGISRADFEVEILPFGAGASAGITSQRTSARA